MRSNFLRMIIAALFAIPVALGLCSVMHKLIYRDFEYPEGKYRKVTVMVRPDADFEVNDKERKTGEVEGAERD